MNPRLTRRLAELCSEPSQRLNPLDQGTQPMKAKKLTLADVTITVTPEEEEISIESQEYESDVAQGFAEMVERHGLWGWCCVKVTVTLGPLRASEYLGCCSYESEADFRQPGGYFDDMAQEALEQLQTKVDALAPLICCG